MSTDDTVVQTELPPAEYERIRRIADREGKSLKETLREAAAEYVRTHAALDEDDPFFAYDPAEPEGGDDEHLTAEDTDEYLYGGE